MPPTKPAGTTVQEPETEIDPAIVDRLVGAVERARGPEKPRLARREVGPIDPTALERTADEILQVVNVRKATRGEQFVSGFGQGVASIAKAPELLGKLSERLGVPKGTIERHAPAVKAIADWGRQLEDGAAALEDPRFADQSFGAQVARGAGSLVPFAAASAVGGTAGGLIGRAAKAAQAGQKIGATVATAAAGIAQASVPMYEDVLAETGSEDKAWAAALVGVPLGASELLGIGRILSKVDRGSGGALRKALTKLALNALEEGAQEFGQTIGEARSKAWITNKEFDTLRELARARDAGLVGMLLGGGVSAADEAIGRAKGAARAPGVPRDALPPEPDRRATPLESLLTGIEQPAPPGEPAQPVAATAVPETAAPATSDESGVSRESAGLTAGRGEGSFAPQPESGGPSTESGTSTPKDAAERILSGEEVALEELTPEAIRRAVERREQITPAPPGRAPGEGQPSATEAVQEPPSTAGGAGVSSVGPQRVERRERDLSLKQEDIEAEQSMQGLVRRIRRQTAGAIDPDLLDQADKDPLTGLANRRADAEQFERIKAASRRKGDRIVRLFGDLDNFKAVNTQFTDAGGDRAIQVVADAWKAAAREGNGILPARKGGDEFVTTIRVGKDTSDADLNLLRDEMEEIAAKALEDAGFGTAMGKKVAASIGWVEFSEGESLDELTKRAAVEAKKRKTERGVSKTSATGEREDDLVRGAETPASQSSSEEARKPTKPETKEDEEAWEAENTRAARQLVSSARRDGATDTEVFDTLLAGYQNQPKQKARTSTSKELQAFSTPLPLAWVASRLAGIGPGISVYEPTAGNGALLIDADASRATANELDPRRADALKRLGFSPRVGDALTAEIADETVDAVIANPPFGKVGAEGGGHKTFEVRPGISDRTTDYRTKEIDHAIAMRALRAMKGDGRAVLILGGHKPFGDPSQAARTEKYRALTQQRFWRSLYENYNVTDHFTVAGKLYDRMGAAWPIDVVVIEGRKPSSKEPPYVAAPRILEAWNEVRALLHGERLESGRGPAVDRGPAGEAAGPLESGVAVAPGEAPARRDRPSQAGAGAEPSGGVERPGAGAAQGDAGRGVAELPPERGGAGAVGRGEPGGVAQEGEAERGGVEGARGDRPARVAGAAAAAPTRGLERVGEFQATYRPSSKANQVGTLVPANMQASMDRALARIESQSGGVDAFVAKKLGYSAKEVSDYFSAEQVDALALAIDNLDSGSGFIVGDQTGVGKGRIVAGILRYAKRLGKIPVFVTAKPGLYADMRRDLADIGMGEFRQFVTNTNLRGQDALVLPDGEKIQSLGKIEHAQAMRDLSSGKGDWDAVFTTYDQQNPRAGEFAARSKWLEELAPRAILVLDESHLAGGTERRGFFKTKEGEEIEKATRSDFFRSLVDQAAGVVYSSATYAKNPHVLTLYTRTDLGQAADREKLPDLVQKGGVPLQQIIASMLVESGQYARREKSYEGIAMDLDAAEVDRAVAERATALLRDLFQLDLLMAKVREDFLKGQGAKGGGVGAGDTAVGEGGAKGGGFSSVMHNVVSQMLLSLKAREVGRKAVETFRAGKKPIVALSNTLEGLLADAAADADVKTGDEIPDFTFARIFDRYLERTRQVIVRSPFGDKAERVYIPDEDMGAMLGPFQDLKEQIAQADLGDMPASPIDAIIAEMEKGGLKVGEITGRELRVQYGDGGKATLAQRKASDAFKKKAMREFNDGGLDALVINQSGSTGYSLHASPKNGKDVRPRHMFVVQADPNIDVFMQMLGRINRTGQTSLPGYTVLVSDLPSEKRPAAILMRKMASLNANTSASRRSAVSLRQVTDFMNKYGDEAVSDILTSEPEVAEAIGLSDEKIAAELERENLARRATGLLPMLPIAEQERLLDMIEENYSARLEEAKAKGENLLEAEALDLKAKTLSSEELVPASGSGPFAEPAIIEQIEASRVTKPLTWAELEARAKVLAGGGEDLEAATRAFISAQEKRIDEALQVQREKHQAAYKKAEAALEGADPEAAKAVQAQLETIKRRFSKLHILSEAIKERLRLLRSRSVSIEADEGAIPAYLVGIEPPKKGNVLAPSAWRLVLAPVEADGYLRIAVSRLMTRARGEEGFVAVVPARSQVGQEDFAGKATERREKRWMVTGNLLAGYQKLEGRGQIVFYTDEAGTQKQGILLKRGANPKKILEGQPVRLTPEQALIYLDTVGGFVDSDDGLLTISTRGEGYPIAFRVKNKGGKPYYLHKAARAAIGDFESRRGKAEWERLVSDRSAALRALKAYADYPGLVLQAIHQKDAAREITGEKKIDLDGPPAPEGRTEMMAFPGSIMPDVRAAIDAIARKIGYVKAQRALVGGTIATETWTERLRRKWQDSFRGIKTLQRDIETAGGELDEDLDVYLAEELRRGRTKTRLEKLDSKHVRPLLAGLRKDGISPEEFGEALMARHAEERNDVIRKRDPKNDAGSGLTDDEAREIMDRIESGKRAEGFARGFARFDALMAETREGWVRDGLKSQKEVDALEEQFQFYAPLRSDLSDDEAGSGFRGTGRGVDVRGGEFKTALGRSTRAEAREVLAYAFTQAQQGIVRGEKNRVAQSFLNLLRANPDMTDGFAKVKPSQAKRALIDGVAKWVYDPLFRLADNVLVVHENGKQVWVEIEPAYQNVADGLKNLGAENAGKLVQHLGAWTRFMAGMSTRYNPVFPLFNAIRDAAGAFINSQEHGLAFASVAVRDIPLALYALTKQKLGKSDGGKWDRYAREYAAGGAPIAFLDLRTFEDQLKLIDSSMAREAATGAIGNIRRGWRALLDVIEAANDIVENGARFSAYVHAREDLGMTPGRAASWSKNLTVNFERKGDLGATMNALYMFANASIQSTARVGAAVKHPAVRRLLAAAFMGAMAWDQIIRAIGGEDDDGEDRWDKIPAYLKRHNLIVMRPDGTYITIPTPFVYDWIQTAAHQLSGVLSGDVKPGSALGEIASAAVESFDPIGSGQLDIGDPASIARTIAPTVLDPIVELATNRDWKGDPIAPTDYGGDKPDSERFWPDASTAAKAISGWLNRATGGDEFEPGLVDVSPETLDHWTGFLAGGLGRTLAQTYEMNQKLVMGEPLTPRDIPFVSRLIREPSPFASTTDFRTLQNALRVERDRAKRDKKLMPAALGGLLKESNRLEEIRQRRRKEIDKLEGDARRVAERELDRTLQQFNRRARKALLTTP